VANPASPRLIEEKNLRSLGFKFLSEEFCLINLVNFITEVVVSYPLDRLGPVKLFLANYRQNLT
jgi:hypothetical protein